MGIDVYLEKCKDYKAAIETESKAEATVELLYKDYGEMTEAQRTSAYEETQRKRAELGCNQYGGSLSRERVKLPSNLYPDHYYKIGYFRSSYNDSGIEHVLETMGVPTLSDIFQPDPEAGEFVPNWELALERCEDALSKYREIAGGPCAGLSVFAVSAGFTSPADLPDNHRAAMVLVENEASKESGSHFPDGYMNSAGHFYWSGIEVVALIPGTQNLLGKMPCTYVVSRRQKTGEPDWYLQSLEIVQETIQYVIGQPDREDYYLIWSA